jgi:hypothetical protein
MPRDAHQAVIVCSPPPSLTSQHRSHHLSQERILNKGRTGVTRPPQDKPYSVSTSLCLLHPILAEHPSYIQRPGPSTTDGSWKHDLYSGPKELIGPPRAGRGKPATRDLVDEVRSSPADKMRGFGVNSERNLATQGKGVTELLPSSRPTATRVAAPRRVVVPTVSTPISLPKRRQTEDVSKEGKGMKTFGVKGTADGPTKVIIQGLLNGTTSDDVKVSPPLPLVQLHHTE